MSLPVQSLSDQVHAKLLHSTAFYVESFQMLKDSPQWVCNTEQTFSSSEEFLLYS